MTVIGYIRVSTDEQDLEKQRHLLLEHSQKHQLLIDEFIEIEISSRKVSVQGVNQAVDKGRFGSSGGPTSP